MTAFGDDASREAARELGATLFDKPFKMGELREVVRRLLARARTAPTDA
jgi:DNA-binding response OmpR family regulator